MELQGLRDLSEGQRYKVRGCRLCSGQILLPAPCQPTLRRDAAPLGQHSMGSLSFSCSWTSVSRRISPSINLSASRAASGPCACTWWAPGPLHGCGRHWASPSPCPGSCGRSGCCSSSRAPSSPRAAWESHSPPAPGVHRACTLQRGAALRVLSPRGLAEQSRWS